MRSRGFHGNGSDSNDPVLVEILSSGMMVLVFQMFRMMPVLTDSWNSCVNIGANSSVQVYRKWAKML